MDPGLGTQECAQARLGFPSGVSGQVGPPQLDWMPSGQDSPLCRYEHGRSTTCKNLGFCTFQARHSIIIIISMIRCHSTLWTIPPGLWLSWPTGPTLIQAHT